MQNHISHTIKNYTLNRSKGSVYMGLLFLVGAGVVIYYLVKNKKVDISSKSDAEDALKRRYVNGEIDDETYLKMKKIIEK